MNFHKAAICVSIDYKSLPHPLLLLGDRHGMPLARAEAPTLRPEDGARQT